MIEIQSNLLIKAIEFNAKEYILNLINGSKNLSNALNEEINYCIKDNIEAVNSDSNLSLKCSDSYEIKESW